MTTTAQHSCTVFNKYTENDIEDSKRLLLSVADSMNKLCENLSRLEYVIQRKNIEIFYPKGKGEAK
jgi:hypothetical protein